MGKEKKSEKEMKLGEITKSLLANKGEKEDDTKNSSIFDLFSNVTAYAPSDKTDLEFTSTKSKKIKKSDGSENNSESQPKSTLNSNGLETNKNKNKRLRGIEEEQQKKRKKKIDEKGNLMEVNTKEEEAKEKELKKEKIEDNIKEEKITKKEFDPVVEEERKKRTIFVGNLPLSFGVDQLKKKLKLRFSKYGTVEKVYLRSAGVANSNLPKRTSYIKEEFHQNSTATNGYVVYQLEESCEKAIKKENSSLFEGNHIVVDNSVKKYNNHKKTVFVGGLPYSITNEALWSLFEKSGEIEKVRVVRDPIHSIGKGIAFVEFKSKDSVKEAVKLDGTVFEERTIRVTPSSKSEQNKISAMKVRDANKRKEDNIVKNELKERRAGKPSRRSQEYKSKLYEGQRSSGKIPSKIFKKK